MTKISIGVALVATLSLGCPAEEKPAKPSAPAAAAAPTPAAEPEVELPVPSDFDDEAAKTIDGDNYRAILGELENEGE